jgi:hypothetical protein
VLEALMSTSVVGCGGEGAWGDEAVAWSMWFGDCGGLDENVSGGGGCWLLKCSGGSTLTLMAARLL